MPLTFLVLYLVFSLIVLYRSIDYLVWEVTSLIYLVAATIIIGFPPFLGLIVWVLVVSVIAINRVDDVRLKISNYIFNEVSKNIPKISETEQTALDVGDTWFEQDIFRGEPNWDKLAAIDPKLSKDEQSFLDVETNELCGMLDEWSISQAQDLPEDAWSYIKKKGFLGLVIPKEYGGRGFSARAHSDIVMKIASRSGVAAVTVMVPNSLGPGELILHYGTNAQKKYYLPKLASGEEVPCFALTEPEAGSDATSIKSDALVVEKTIESKKVLGLEISLNKRWITLAPIATILGLAVNLQDPNGLLKGVGREGITCILLPRDTKNLEIGNRHLPAHLPLMNGTIRGENIFVPITSIIGGQEMAGHGWKMLVECLSIGRSISLPALSAASSGVAYLTTGAFSRIRQQFNVEIGQFEGVKEKLAEIAGLNYIVNATRMLTLAAVDDGKKPSVASGITKYFNTELARITLNHAMDVHGGRAVVLGPRNYLSNYYSSMPVYITVEGANIMTRSLLIFSQGSMAAHPYIRDELAAVREDDKSGFNKLIWQHIHYFSRNFAKTICTAFTGGMFINVPDGKLNGEYKKLTRLSYAYSWLADLSLMYLGGSLKRKERLSSRLADGMSYLYMASASLHYAKDIDKSSDSEMHARWAANYCFYHAQKSMLEFCNNFPSRIFGKIIGFIAYPFGQSMRLPDDKLDNKIADLMMSNNTYRQDIIKSLFLSEDINQPIERMEHAFQLLIEHGDLYKKSGKLSRLKLNDLEDFLQEKVANGELSKEELKTIITLEKARWDAILVDEFSPETIKNKKFAAFKHADSSVGSK
ncbi:MAG: acyl-CoA dehydrogenase [Legionellaceae bacterium]|nr:acyl-CoA dehydrogenase [Legionellaceae bacterium]